MDKKTWKRVIPEPVVQHQAPPSSPIRQQEDDQSASESDASSDIEELPDPSLITPASAGANDSISGGEGACSYFSLAENESVAGRRRGQQVRHHYPCHTVLPD
jgi:hypothetical protein